MALFVAVDTFLLLIDLMRDQEEKREYCTKNKIYLLTHNPREWKEKIKFNSEYHTNRELSKCQFSRAAPNYDFAGQSYSHNFSSTSFHSFNNSAIVDYKRNRSFCNVEVKMHILRHAQDRGLRHGVLKGNLINSWSRTVLCLVARICEGDKIYHNFLPKKIQASQEVHGWHIFLS